MGVELGEGSCRAAPVHINLFNFSHRLPPSLYARPARGPASVTRQNIKDETELLARGAAADGRSSQVLRGSDGALCPAPRGPGH